MRALLGLKQADIIGTAKQHVLELCRVAAKPELKNICLPLCQNGI